MTTQMNSVDCDTTTEAPYWLIQQPITSHCCKMLPLSFALPTAVRGMNWSMPIVH